MIFLLLLLRDDNIVKTIDGGGGGEKIGGNGGEAGNTCHLLRVRFAKFSPKGTLRSQIRHFRTPDLIQLLQITTCRRMTLGYCWFEIPI